MKINIIVCMQSAKLFCTAPIFCNHLSPKIKRVGWQITKVTSVRIGGMFQHPV